MSSEVFRKVPRSASIGRLLVAGAIASGGLSSFVNAQDAPKPQPVATAPVPRTDLPLKLAPRPTKSAITADDLRTRLSIFADDSLMGRDAGTEGSFKAAKPSVSACSRPVTAARSFRRCRSRARRSTRCRRSSPAAHRWNWARSGASRAAAR